MPKILTPPLLTATIHQFPHPTWIENLAIRHDGSLLCTLLTTPSLYLLSPNSNFAPILLHTFTPYLSLTGIVESKVTPDVFFVAAGDYDVFGNGNSKGSWSVWCVDLRSYSRDGDARVGVSVKKIVDVSESGLLNGMELLFNVSKGEEKILIADSEVGCIWTVDPVNGQYEKVIAVAEMEAPKEGLPMGINGVKVLDGFVYWTNTGLELFCRIQINVEGKVVGGTEILVRGLLVDDFCFDGEGNAWMAQNVLNVVSVVKVGGGWDGQNTEDDEGKRGREVVVVAGDKGELTVAGGTACQFGRGEGDRDVLYLVTSGGLAAPVNGTETEGGKVVAIQTKGVDR